MSSLGLQLDLDGERLTAVRLEESGRWEVETVDADADGIALLADWLSEAAGRVGLSVPAQLIARRPRFPFTQGRKIRQVLPLHLEGGVPGRLDDYDRQVSVGEDAEGGYAAVTLLRNEVAEGVLDLLESLDLTVRFAEPEALVMAQDAATGDEGRHVHIWIGPRRITATVFDDRGFSYAFSIPFGIEQLRDEGAASTLRNRLLAGLHEPVTRWRIDGAFESRDEVESVFAPLEEDIELEVVDRTGEPNTARGRIALAAARAAASRGRPIWNLAPRPSLISAEIFKDRLVWSLAAPALAAVLFLALSFNAGTGAIEAQAAAYRSNLAEIYSRNFPDSRVVDPVRQMRSVLERYGGRSDEGGTQAPVIERLRSFHEQITAGTELTISEFRVSGREWIAKGEASDFATVDRLKSALDELDWPSGVRVQRAEQTVDRSAIRFQITWSAPGGES